MEKTYTEEEIKEWFLIMKDKYHGSKAYETLSRIEFMMFDELWEKNNNLNTIIEQRRKEKED